MKPSRRRIGLGLGATLLVAGWGLTGYAEAQQEAVSIGKDRFQSWITSKDISHTTYRLPLPAGSRPPSHITITIFAGRTIYATGIFAMALGAGVLGFSVLPESRE